MEGHKLSFFEKAKISLDLFSPFPVSFQKTTFEHLPCSNLHGKQKDMCGGLCLLSLYYLHVIYQLHWGITIQWPCLAEDASKSKVKLFSIYVKCILHFDCSFGKNGYLDVWVLYVLLYGNINKWLTHFREILRLGE